MHYSKPVVTRTQLSGALGSHHEGSVVEPHLHEES